MREGTNAVERQEHQLGGVVWLRTIQAGAHELGEELPDPVEVVEGHHGDDPRPRAGRHAASPKWLYYCILDSVVSTVRIAAFGLVPSKLSFL